MIGIVIKIVLLGAFLVLVACAIGLFVMAGVAQSHDIVALPVPQSSFIASTQPLSDYSDAFVAPMHHATFRDIDRVAEQAFHRGDQEVFRDEREVVYQGRMLGVNYHLSYMLLRDPSPTTLTVSTTVKFENKYAHYYWPVLKQVHRRLMPYLLDRMVVLAPD